MLERERNYFQTSGVKSIDAMERAAHALADAVSAAVPAGSAIHLACGTGGKRKRNVINSLYIQPDELERLVVERYKRYDVVAEKETMSESYLTDDAEIVIAAYGASARIAKNAIAAARAEGIKVGLVRPITLWPFPDKAFQKAAETAKAFLTVEMSMGQMIDDVKLAINCAKPVHFFGRTGGVVPTPAEILAQLRKIHGGEQ